MSYPVGSGAGVTGCGAVGGGGVTNGSGVGATVGGGIGVMAVITVGRGVGVIGFTGNGVVPGSGVGYWPGTPLTSNVGETNGVGDGEILVVTPELLPGPEAPHPNTTRLAPITKIRSPIFITNTILASGHDISRDSGKRLRIE